MIKNLPACARDKRDPGSILGQEDLEEEMAIHSSILAWEIPWREKPDGKCNPLRYSCLGNPTDREAWQALSMGSERVRLDLAIKQQQQQHEVQGS